MAMSIRDEKTSLLLNPPGRREVPDDEYVDIDVLLEKFHQGALQWGSDQMSIGWPDELLIGGQNVIRLLRRLRDEYYDELEGVKRALDAHRVPDPEGLSQADRIHLLVGRKAH